MWTGLKNSKTDIVVGRQTNGFLPIISRDDDLAFTLAWKALDGGTAGAKLSQNKQSLHGVKQTKIPFINSVHY